MSRRLLGPVATLAAVLALAGCGGEAEPKANSTPTASVEPTASETPTTPEATEGVEGQGPRTPDTVALAEGESVDIMIRPSGIAGQELSEVKMTLKAVRYVPGDAVEAGTVAVYLDLEFVNLAQTPADLRGLDTKWEGADGLVKSDVESIPDGAPEWDLGPGQRTEGSKRYDVPSEPGFLLIEAFDKVLSVRLDPK